MNHMHLCHGLDKILCEIIFGPGKIWFNRDATQVKSSELIKQSGIENKFDKPKFCKILVNGNVI